MDISNEPRVELPLRGLLLLGIVLVLYQFSVDIREAATVSAKKKFFGSYTNAAAICSYFDTANVLVVFLTAPFLASLSDTIGRYPILLWEVVGIAIPNLCLAAGFSFWWYLVTDNLLPGDECVMYAFVADLTHSLSIDNRALCFGTMTASLSAGSLLGYCLHGFLDGHVSQSTVFLASAGASLVALVAAFFLPESLPKDRRRGFSLRESNPWGVLRFLNQYQRTLAIYFVVYSIMQFAHVGYDSIVDMYNAQEFGLQGVLYDEYWLLCTIVELLSSFVLVKAISQYCSAKATLLIGTSLVALGYVAGGVAAVPWQAFGAGVLHASGSIWEPGFMALVTSTVRDDQEGVLQGALASVAALVGFGAPVIFGKTFQITEASFPALVWLIAALCAFAAIVLASFAPAAKTTSCESAVIGTADDASMASVPMSHEDVAPFLDDERATSADMGSVSMGKYWIALLCLFGLLNAVLGLWLTFSFPD